MSDYKPSPFHRSPFSIGMAVLILIIFIAFCWTEWGHPLVAEGPKPTSDNASTPMPAKQNGGTQP